MDKFEVDFSDKLKAADFIKANGEAEASELLRLKSQSEHMDDCIGVLENISGELNGSFGEKFREASFTVDKASTDLEGAVDAMKKAVDEVRRYGEEQKKQDSSDFDSTKDHIHKESVKVYRNVQASTISELEKLGAELTERLDTQNQVYLMELQKLNSRISVALGFAVASALFSAAGVALFVLSLLKII